MASNTDKVRHFDYNSVKAQFLLEVDKTGPYSLFMDQYNMLIESILSTPGNKQFDVCEQDGRKYLIKKGTDTGTDKPLKYLTVDEYFNVIVKCHLTYQHLRRDLLCKVMKKDYADFAIPPRYIYSVVQLCNICCEKKIPTLKYRSCIDSTSRNSKLIIPKIIYNKCQKCNEVYEIYIHDMKDYADGNFRYLLIYKEDYNSFVFLRPLIKKCSFEAATEISKISLSFGLPKSLLVSNIDVKFFTDVLMVMNGMCGSNTDLYVTWRKNSLWADKIVKELLDWMTATGCKQWGFGCHIVQLQINQKWKSDKNNSMSPFQSMFIDARNENYMQYKPGNQSATETPEEVIQTVDLVNSNSGGILSVGKNNWQIASSDINNIFIPETMTQQIEAPENKCIVCKDTIYKSFICVKCSQPVHLFCAAQYPAINPIGVVCLNCIK